MLSLDIVERANEVMQGKVSVDVRKRLARTAEEISRAGTLKAQTETIRSAILKLIPILYERNHADYFANFDRHTGQILIPVPWGKLGYQTWGLRGWEAECLRRILLHRCEHRGAVPELFDYSNYTRRWYVQANDYPTVEHAAHWLKQYGPTMQEWQLALDNQQTARHNRREKKKAKLRRKRASAR